MRIHRTGIALLLILGLAACATTPRESTASPEPTATTAPPPASTPTPEPDPQPATLVLGGAAVEVRSADGTTIATLPLDGSPDAMLVGLEAVLGPATPADDPAYCEYYRWGGADDGVLLAVFDGATPGFNVRTTTARIGGIAITGSAGFGVDEDITAYLTEHPTTEIGSVEFDPSPVYDGLGAIALIEGDSGTTAHLIVTPEHALTSAEYCS